MYITHEEVKKILTVMEAFSDAKSYKLEVDNSSGIGRILTITMNMDINGRNTHVKVDISGAENW